jgi:hypothetical protein
MEHPSKGVGVEGVVRRNPSDRSVTVTGRITGLGVEAQKITWSAAAPLTRGLGFNGAGMPYPNKEIAYENTPHAGVLYSPDGSFTITLKDIPAGYYSGLGSIYVPPLITFDSVTKSGKRLQSTLWINDTAAPYRWISGAPPTMKPEMDSPESSGRAMYYLGREALPIFENQEALLRARGYPSDMTERGWPEADDARPWARVPPPA